MSARPLIQKGIADLEKMFSEAQGDQTTLRQLRAELKYRKLVRAVTLLKKVESSLAAAEHRPAIGSASSLLPDAFSPGEGKAATDSEAKEAINAPTEIKAGGGVESVPVPRSASSTPVASARRETINRDLLSSVNRSLTVEQAYRLLGVVPASSWEVIEHARRKLVDKAHPDVTAGLNEEQQEKAQTEARRVNDAYIVLARARTNS